MIQVAIVGAGMAGAACARALTDAGLAPTLLDREPSAGGRLSGFSDGCGQHDLGAQYFTAQDPEFRRLTELWLRSGRAALWKARTADPVPRPRLVGVPAMTTIVQAQVQGLPICTCTQVERLERHQGRWEISDGRRSLGQFDAIVIATPPADAQRLLPRHRLSEVLDHVQLDPCWSLVATFERPLPLDIDVLEPRDGGIGFAARNGSKPGRHEGETWTIHAAGRFSMENRLMDVSAVTALMLDCLIEATGEPLPPVSSSHARFWANSRVVRAVGEPCLSDPIEKLFLAGDWCIGPRVEAAWLSGRAAAAAFLDAL